MNYTTNSWRASSVKKLSISKKQKKSEQDFKPFIKERNNLGQLLTQDVQYNIPKKSRINSYNINTNKVQDNSNTTNYKNFLIYKDNQKTLSHYLKIGYFSNILDNEKNIAKQKQHKTYNNDKFVLNDFFQNMLSQNPNKKSESRQPSTKYHASINNQVKACPYVGYYPETFKQTFDYSKKDLNFHREKTGKSLHQNKQSISQQYLEKEIKKENEIPKQQGYVELQKQLPRDKCHSQWLQKDRRQAENFKNKSKQKHQKILQDIDFQVQIKKRMEKYVQCNRTDNYEIQEKKILYNKDMQIKYNDILKKNSIEDYKSDFEGYYNLQYNFNVKN